MGEMFDCLFSIPSTQKQRGALMEERFTFGIHSLDILARHRETLEHFGYTCTEEVSHVGRHELHTLIAIVPKKENPIRFTRAVYAPKASARAWVPEVK